MGVESFKEAGLRGDKICVVSHEKGVERNTNAEREALHHRGSHKVGVERNAAIGPDRVSHKMGVEMLPPPI
jgi:hypothetical protein